MSALPESLPACLQDEPLIARLCERAGAARWGVGRERFARALAGAVASRFGGTASSAPSRGARDAAGAAAAVVAGVAVDAAAGVAADAATLERFLDGLHLEDLALAVACADGHEPAWDFFVTTYRADLRRAAGAIAGVDHGDDLADTLLGELFGVDARGAARRSLFLYFHGRSRLSTWLRAILSQRQVDRVRASRRTVSLDAMEPSDSDDVAAGAGVGVVSVAAVSVGAVSYARGGPGPVLDPDRDRLVSALQQAIDAALAGLDANERLRLTCYHIDGMTLAEMGRMFREHEATASRKLTRIRTRVREAVDEFLRTRAGLDSAQIRLGYEYALEAGGVELGALGKTPEAGADGARNSREIVLGER